MSKHFFLSPFRLHPAFSGMKANDRGHSLPPPLRPLPHTREGLSETTATRAFPLTPLAAPPYTKNVRISKLMPLTKVGPKYQVTIPKEAREAIGLSVGDLVEATTTKEGVLLRPKIVVDKHPEVEARLREAEEDIKAGRVYGPFRSVAEMRRSLRGLKKPQRKPKKTS